MLPKEIIIKTIEHQELSTVPYMLNIHPDMVDNLINKLGYDYREVAPNYFGGAGLKLPMAEINDNLFKDVFGCVWNHGEHAREVVKNPLEQPDLSNYKFPDLSKPEYYDSMATKIEPDKDKRLIVLAFPMILFERAWALRGVENLLMDMIENTGFCECLFSKLTELSFIILENCRNMGFEMLHFKDDYGMQKGLIMGPVLWRRFIKPNLIRIFNKAHELGMYVMLHSCGDNTEIMEELIDTGLDVFNPFQPEAMDIFEMKRLYGHRVTFWGGIITNDLLLNGEPEQVRKHMRNNLKILGKGGGYIAGTYKPIYPNISLKNAVALVDSLVRQN
jgi:uroporphyrinogen decarboxylase